MSSELHRGDRPLDVRPMVWRPVTEGLSQVGGGSPQPGGGRPAAAHDPDTSDSGLQARIEELERQAEARAQAARQAGFIAGQVEGAKKAAARLEPALASLTRVIDELAGMRKRLRAEAEQDVVRLALAIARRVLHREMATDPEAVLGLVKAASETLDAREIHRLRVSPPDASLLTQFRERLGFPPRVEVVADAALEAGSAIFETARGSLDVSVNTQLAEIDRGFADLVRRRAR